MKIEKIKSDIDKLIKRGNEVMSLSEKSHDKTANEIAFRVSVLSYLSNLLGNSHVFYLEFKDHSISGIYIHMAKGLAILKALKEDISEEWLFNLKQLITAELFTDFLSMAEHLLENNYKDASAVMIGSTLESHLKNLCIKYGIMTSIVDSQQQSRPKKSDTINAELRKENIYNVLDQKQITAWLDLRNKAAHGEYDEYNLDQVKQMYSGVLSFISRTSS